MTQYPRITTAGAMLALRAVLAQNAPADYNSERMAHEFSALNRMARSHTALQVRKCNEPWTDALQKRYDGLRLRIANAMLSLFPKPPTLMEFHGDPRGGYTVTAQFKGDTRDWIIG